MTMSRHSPGPWRWTKQFTGQWALMTGRSLLVMDFVRQGMSHAQPRFSDRNGEPRGGLMHKAEDLDLTQHPDAVLIAAAPDLLVACKAVVTEMSEWEGPEEPEDGEGASLDAQRSRNRAVRAYESVRAAVARAEGGVQ